MKLKLTSFEFPNGNSYRYKPKAQEILVPKFLTSGAFIHTQKEFFQTASPNQNKYLS